MLSMQLVQGSVGSGTMATTTNKINVRRLLMMTEELLSLGRAVWKLRPAGSAEIMFSINTVDLY